MRWHPLPIDSQVAAALEERKQKFMQAYSKVPDDQDPTEQWVFNHICTVLEHAKKIFEMSEEEFLDPRLITKSVSEIVSNE